MSHYFQGLLEKSVATLMTPCSLCMPLRLRGRTAYLFLPRTPVHTACSGIGEENTQKASTIGFVGA